MAVFQKIPISQVHPPPDLAITLLQGMAQRYEASPLVPLSQVKPALALAGEHDTVNGHRIKFCR